MSTLVVGMKSLPSLPLPASLLSLSVSLACLCSLHMTTLTNGNLWVFMVWHLVVHTKSGGSSLKNEERQLGRGWLSFDIDTLINFKSWKCIWLVRAIYWSFWDQTLKKKNYLCLHNWLFVNIALVYKRRYEKVLVNNHTDVLEISSRPYSYE